MDHCIVKKSALDHWFIANAEHPELAWTGSGWAHHIEGIPNRTSQICNFADIDEAVMYATQCGLQVKVTDDFKDARFWNQDVRDPAIETRLRDIGNRLRSACPEGFGFVLMMFNFGESGNLFYTSNAQREDVIKLLKEFIEKRG